MATIILFIILVAVSLSIAIPPYLSDRELNEKTELLVVVDGIHYLLNYHSVSWEQARVECEDNQGSLAVVDTEEKQSMIAKAMVENLPDGDNWWIGAYYNVTTNWWMWSDVGRVSEKSSPDDFYKTPSALDPKVKPMAHCVVLDICERYSNMLFANLPCASKNPFLCQLPGPNMTHSPRPILPPITVRKDGSSLVLYSAMLTWTQADSFCRRIGQQLAVLKSPHIITELSDKVLRTRPEMKGNIWIGARKFEKRWIWATRWADFRLAEINNGNKMADCVVLDVSSADKPLLVDSSCDVPSNFVCQMDPDESMIFGVYATEDKWSRVSEDDRLYLSLNPLPWGTAARVCASNNGHLLHLDNKADDATKKKLMNEVTLAMTRSPIEVTNIWLGARLVDNVTGNKWVWCKKPSPPYYGRDDVTFDLGELDNWVDVCNSDDHSSYYPCLNLEHEEESPLITYGVQCEYPQHFICQVDVATTDTIVKELGRRKEYVFRAITIWKTTPPPPVINSRSRHRTTIMSPTDTTVKELEPLEKDDFTAIDVEKITASPTSPKVVFKSTKRRGRHFTIKLMG